MQISRKMTRQSKRNRQKNKRGEIGDKKWESNNIPETPDRG